MKVFRVTNMREYELALQSIQDDIELISKNVEQNIIKVSHESLIKMKQYWQQELMTAPYRHEGTYVRNGGYPLEKSIKVSKTLKSTSLFIRDQGGTGLPPSIYYQFQGFQNNGSSKYPLQYFVNAKTKATNYLKNKLSNLKSNKQVK